jgi:NAD(P)-dependent dehydrogenase (short-subunit alcohol dehydrogenase family)
MFAKDAVALVTSSATGIGLATAQAFARAGYRVVLADRDSERGEVADAVVWLCSRQASFITGHALAVDGGMLAH